jgi:hypothetical protein
MFFENTNYFIDLKSTPIFMMDVTTQVPFSCQRVKET